MPQCFTGFGHKADFIALNKQRQRAKAPAPIGNKTFYGNRTMPFFGTLLNKTFVNASTNGNGVFGFFVNRMFLSFILLPIMLDLPNLFAGDGEFYPVLKRL
jgi:hypothetical protein